MGVRPGTTVWWGEHQPLAESTLPDQRGQPSRRQKRDEDHQPITVAKFAHTLPGQAWQSVTWREGTSGPLSSRFARVSVRAAHLGQPRDEEWLIIEWAEGAKAPAHYWFSNMSTRTAWQDVADTVMSRWLIERDYEVKWLNGCDQPS